MPTKAAIQQELRERERELSELRDRLERMSSVSLSPQMESGQAGEPEKAVKKFTLSSAELTLIGKFSGSASQSSFDEWVQKVEIVFSSNQLSEAEKARTIPLLLTGGAYYSTISCAEISPSPSGILSSAMGMTLKIVSGRRCAN